MKVLLHYRPSRGFRSLLEEVCPATVDLAIVDERDDAGFARSLRDVDALLHVLRPISAADIASAPNLKLIQKIGVGVNTIALEAAAARGIAVCNMPGTNSQAVAEHTLMLMLAALRRVRIFDNRLRAGLWQPQDDDIDQVGEICGRTVGFIGFGAIATALAPVVNALGGKVIYTARSPKNDVPWRYLSRDALLAEADIVSLHVPCDEATRGMIDRHALAGMKRGAVLINTARGELVDEVALLEALRTGQLAAAGLDVFAMEPLAGNHPLLALPNVVVTPHLAWLTPETLRRSLAIGFENCRRVMAKEDLLHRVI
jgi:phosphoglycerate dehydrogenase-like enzyme